MDTIRFTVPTLIDSNTVEDLKPKVNLRDVSLVDYNVRGAPTYSSEDYEVTNFTVKLYTVDEYLRTMNSKPIDVDMGIRYLSSLRRHENYLNNKDTLVSVLEFEVATKELVGERTILPDNRVTRYTIEQGKITGTDDLYFGSKPCMTIRDKYFELDYIPVSEQVDESTLEEVAKKCAKYCTINSHGWHFDLDSFCKYSDFIEDLAISPIDGSFFSKVKERLLSNNPKRTLFPSLRTLRSSRAYLIEEFVTTFNIRHLNKLKTIGGTLDLPDCEVDKLVTYGGIEYELKSVKTFVEKESHCYKREEPKVQHLKLTGYTLDMKVNTHHVLPITNLTNIKTIPLVTLTVPIYCHIDGREEYLTANFKVVVDYTTIFTTLTNSTETP